MTEFLELDKICRIVDCPHESPEWKKNGGVTVIRNFNLVDGRIDLSNHFYVDEETYEKRVRRSVPEAGDIIFSREAPIGNCAIIPDGFKCCLGQRLVLLKVDRNICDPEYLLAMLMSDFVKQQIDQVAKTGSIVSNFAIGDLKKLIIPISDNKKEISKITKLSGDLISCEKKIHNTLSSLNELIYSYWFNQYNFPDSSQKPYCDNGGKMHYDEKVHACIPDGWNVVKIADLIKSYRGGDWGDDEPTKSHSLKVNCIRGTDFPIISIGAYGELPTRYISEKNADKILEEHDIVIEISGHPGNIVHISNGVLSRFKLPLISSNFCCAFSLKNPDYSYWFYYLWKSLHESGVTTGFSGKTTIANLQFDIMVENVFVPVPPDSVIKKFNSVAAPYFEEDQRSQMNVSNVTSIREYITPLLLSSQISSR